MSKRVCDKIVVVVLFVVFGVVVPMLVVIYEDHTKLCIEAIMFTIYGIIGIVIWGKIVKGFCTRCKTMMSLLELETHRGVKCFANLISKEN